MPLLSVSISVIIITRLTATPQHKHYRAADSGQRAAGSGQRAAGSGQRAAGSGQRAAGSGQRARSIQDYGWLATSFSGKMSLPKPLNRRTLFSLPFYRNDHHRDRSGGAKGTVGHDTCGYSYNGATREPDNALRHNSDALAQEAGLQKRYDKLKSAITTVVPAIIKLESKREYFRRPSAEVPRYPQR